MAKYLIQDIIPPEKKSGGHARKSAAKTASHKAEAVHHKAPTEEATLRAHTTHRAVEHTTHHTKKEDAEEISAPAVETNEVIMHEPEPVSDPKEMILEHMNAPEEVHEEVEEVHTPESARTQSYFAGTLESSSTHEPDAAWPYGSNPSGPTEHVSPPPEIRTNYGGGGDTSTSLESSIWKGWMPWIAGVALVAIVTFFGMNFFSGATVTVLPKKDDIPMDQKLTALKNPLNGELPYAVMKVTLEETREVPATGEKTVTAKASGHIFVYNTQVVAQRLIKNTRFQSPTGKIYRIKDSINIPKATTKSGKTTPGSIEVVVYADEAGPDYNSDPVDFTVPGLKGSPTFDKVYARSKGPITGGASGVIKSVSDLDLKQASDDLRIQLETKLRSKARNDLAPSQIGYDQGMVVELSEAALSKNPASSADKAVVAQSGTLYFLTFDRSELTRAIVRSLIPTWKGEEVSVENLESLDVSMQKLAGEALWGSDKIDLVLKGTPTLLWKVNEADVKKAILGAPKDNFNALLAQFPTIDRAKATIHPVWKRSFPGDEADITVEIVQSMPK